MSGKQITQSLIAISSIVLFVTAFNGTQQLAWAQVQTGNQTQFQSQAITGDALKNNPMAQKILLEIEYSK
ncbi:MAG TPA: hypothetical protein VNX68_01250, partial [Nitrosopumilaceae archaeon]|nr:hypothetical protein [Nitrosopumilaceae archaeon]